MTDSQKLKELRTVFDYFRCGLISDSEAVRHMVDVLPTDCVNTVLAEIPVTLLEPLIEDIFSIRSEVRRRLERL